MAEEPRNRRFWLETALIFAAWTVFGLISSNQYYTQSELIGRPEPWGKVLPSSKIYGSGKLRATWATGA